MANNDFYTAPVDDPVVPVVDPVDEKIKVGDKEYSQADLQRLVGLGEIGAEAESKYKTRIDRVWPQFQSVINEKRTLEEKAVASESAKAELERRIQELETRHAQTQNQNGNQQTYQPPQLTPDQIKAEAIKQAKELGIPMSDDVRRITMEVMQGQQLINDVGNVIDNMTEEGLPNATVEDILSHMQSTGIRNPEKAYKDMFEKEYFDNQLKKLEQVKRAPGLPSVSQSQAGSKLPPANTNFRRMKDSDLTAMINDALGETL